MPIDPLWRNLVQRRGPVTYREQRLVVYLVVLLAVLVWLIYVAMTSEHFGPWATTAVLVILIVCLGLAWAVRHSHSSEHATLRLAGTPLAPGETDLTAHRARLAALLLRTACTIDRAVCEASYQADRKAAEQREDKGQTRQRILNLARRADLWPEFDGHEQDLLMAPEGYWTPTDIWPRVMLIENVRVLRWVIELDDALTPFEALTPDLRPALDLTQKPRLVEGAACRQPWDLRRAQTVAQKMLERCVQEGVHRGILTTEDEAMRAACLTLAQRMGEGRDEDLLLGNQTIADTEKDRLQWIATAALRRSVLLGTLIDYLSGPADAKLPTA
jgi:hypothetical protein